MAVGDRAGAHVLDDTALRGFEPADDERHDPPAVQEQDPADGPTEQEFAAPVVELGVPVHLLGEREVAQDAREDVRQHVDGGLAPELLPEGQVDALGILHALEVGTSTPFFRAKPAAAGVGSPSGRKAAVTAAPSAVFEVGLALGDMCDPDGQAAAC